MNQYQATAGPSRRTKSKRPFVSAENRPAHPDGKFRVVLVSTGSVASVKIPDIVGALARIPEIELQIVATKASLHFYNQARVDAAVRNATGNGQDMAIDGEDHDEEGGVRIWKDEDEWSDWKEIGDPILHIELRRWADLVVIAPCSADFLAKLAAGFSDNLALSMMRALTPDTPVIICPAMNTHMYQHTFTADHLKVVQQRLKYMISGPQGAGKLACGDEGVGKMTDWRDIVSMIENFGAMFVRNLPAPPTFSSALPAHPAAPPDLPRSTPYSISTTQPTINPSAGPYISPVSAPPAQPAVYRPPTPPTPPTRKSKDISLSVIGWDRTSNAGEQAQAAGSQLEPEIGTFAMQDWRTMAGPYGGDGSMWTKKWWIA